MTDVIKVKMYPAKNGDSFLMKASSSEDSFAILVDGGYSSTFKNVIRADLEDLVELDLVIASHVDADHILGILELFKHNGKSDSPDIVKINNVWHNSLRSITGQLNQKSHPPKGVIRDIIKKGFPAPEFRIPTEISARQGSSLAASLLRENYTWNEGVGLSSINCDTTEDFYIGSEMKISVITPSVECLNRLKKWWVQKLKELGHFKAVAGNAFYDDAFEFMCADEKLQSNRSMEEISHSSKTCELSECYVKDNSVVNASSISFILHWKNKKLLFLADSWAEHIETEILKLSSGSQIVFDCIKISHHGSMRNTSPTLLDLIDAKIFLISSNGEKHDHPDFSVLKAIVDRPANFERNLYFNYSTKASQKLIKYKEHSEQSFNVYEEALDWIEV